VLGRARVAIILAALLRLAPREFGKETLRHFSDVASPTLRRETRSTCAPAAATSNDRRRIPPLKTAGRPATS
jgi:hypothetical protein